MKSKNFRAYEISNIKFKLKPVFAKPAQHRLQRTAAGFPPCGGLRGTAKDHRLPFDGLPRKDRGLCRDRSTTSRFFPGTERQDGVRARFASKGAIIQASLASPAAAAEPIR